MEKKLKINNLSARIYLPNGTLKEVVIGIHGFGGDKESSVLVALGNSLIQKNIALLTYDLPCHGENDVSKPLSLEECFFSVKAVYDYVRKNYKNAKISFFATSFGGYLLLNFLNNNEIECNKIILRAPAIFMHKVLTDVILKEHFPNGVPQNEVIEFGYEKTLLIDNKFISALKANDLHDYKNSHFLYSLQGKKDDLVDPDANEKFFETRCKGNYKIFYFENADHRFKKPGELDELIKITEQILEVK